MDINRDVSYIKCTRCADVYTESVADYILPDYLGDVRKILFTEASVRPSGRFADGEVVEFSGIVDYNVVYLDAEGHLASAEFTSDYDFSVRCSESYHDSVADTRVVACNIRLVGPRKINARATIRANTRLMDRCSISTSGSAFDCQYTPEIDSGWVNVSSCRISSVSEREYAESIMHLDGAIADEVSVVYSSGECSVEERIAEDGAVRLKGKLRIKAVIKNGDEPAFGVEKAIPFDETIDFGELSGEMSIIPKMTLTSLKMTVNPDEGGCDVVASAIVECYIVGEENDRVSIILDGYLKECPTDNSYVDFKYSTLLDNLQIKSAHSCEHPRSEVESDGLREIILLSSDVKLDNIEMESGRLVLSGEVKYSGIASEMIDDAVSYVGIKFSSPFSINVNHNCQIDSKVQVEAALSSFETSASLDAERIYASCNIEGRVSLYGNNEKTVLATMAIGENAHCESDRAKITVYYPSGEETLFSVAKRFRTSGLKLAQDNDITASVFAADNEGGGLDGVKKLIIY